METAAGGMSEGADSDTDETLTHTEEADPAQADAEKKEETHGGDHY